MLILFGLCGLLLSVSLLLQWLVGSDAVDGGGVLLLFALMLLMWLLSGDDGDVDGHGNVDVVDVIVANASIVVVHWQC